MLVSVVMITYGHEKYISDAIKGVFLQKTDFPFELIIANDNSPDNSDIIIKNLIKSAPENIIVKYTKHDENLGIIPNFKWALSEARGKYIALCEGDDYWTDPNKLKKQVDFLEKYNSFTLCYHRVYYLRKGEEILLPHHQEKNLEKEFGIDDISKVNFINTPSVVFKNIINYNSPIFGDKIGDYPLWILLAEKGKIKYFPEVMSVYREGVGVQSSLTRIEQINNMLNACEKISTETKFLSVKKNMAQQILNLAEQKRKYKKLENPIYKSIYTFSQTLNYYFKKFIK